MKTIKDAVIELDGKLPCNTMQHSYAVVEGMLLDRRKSPVECYVCKVEEFEAEAERLGYINGYRWGVEYPTNGKRPDLEDDVLVDIHHKEWWYANEKAGTWNWRDQSTAFRITDQRYKPADEVSEIAESINKAEYVSELRDNKPFDRKVSGFVRAAANKIMDDIMKKEPIGMSEKRTPDISDLIVALSEASNLAVDLGLTDCARDILEVCKSAKKDRKREKTVDAAMSLSADYYDAHTLFYAMYDAGMLVLPQDSSDTE